MSDLRCPACNQVVNASDPYNQHICKPPQIEMTSLREIKAGIMNILAAQDRIWQGQAAVEKNVLVAIAELRKDQGEINLYKQRLATSEACRNNLAIALETERTKHKNRASRKTNKVRGGPKRAPRKPRHKRKKT